MHSGLPSFFCHTGAFVLFTLPILVSCKPSQVSSDTKADASAVTLTHGIAPAVAADPGPVRVDTVPVADDLPTFVVRGAREHRHQMVFVPGMCVHPGGYIMSFAHAAAERGDLVGVQGDVKCSADGVLRSWSSDLEAMDRRINAAFVAAGLGEPRELIVIGYSQGAERAEKLVAKWPQKYSRAISIASPITPSPTNKSVKHAKSIALMAGSYDISRERMENAVKPLERAGVAARYWALPNAYHGQMGSTPEETMRAALDFVEQ